MGSIWCEVYKRLQYQVISGYFKIWLNINGLQVVLLPSVLEENIKAVKNAVV